MDQERIRTLRLELRLSTAEKEQIQARARAAELPLSEFIRQACLSGPYIKPDKGTVRTPPKKEDVRTATVVAPKPPKERAKKDDLAEELKAARRAFPYETSQAALRKYRKEQ